MGKAQLMELIHGVGIEQARNTINRIMAENRKISEIEAKKKKMILPQESIKVLEYFWFEVK